MFKCLTDKSINLDDYIKVADTLDSAASDRFILSNIKVALPKNDTTYICKFGNSTSEMDKVEISYTNSPISEYITCKTISKIMFDTYPELNVIVQNVELGIDCDKNKIFVMCEFYKKAKLVSLFNLAKMADIQLWDSKISFNKAIKVLEESYSSLYNNKINKETKVLERQYIIYLVLSYIFGNGDLHSKNYSLRDNIEPEGAIYYDFGASLKNKLSDEQCNKYINLSRDKRLEKLKNERFNYLNDNGKETQIIDLVAAFYDTQKILEENDIVKIVEDILGHINFISDVRKSFYAIYVSDRIWYLKEHMSKKENSNIESINEMKSLSK